MTKYYCGNCGHSLTTRADRCPYCGASLQNTREGSTRDQATRKQYHNSVTSRSRQRKEELSTLSKRNFVGLFNSLIPAWIGVGLTVIGNILVVFVGVAGLWVVIPGSLWVTLACLFYLWDVQPSRETSLRNAYGEVLEPAHSNKGIVHDARVSNKLWIFAIVLLFIMLIYTNTYSDERFWLMSLPILAAVGVSLLVRETQKEKEQRIATIKREEQLATLPADVRQRVTQLQAIQSELVRLQVEYETMESNGKLSGNTHLTKQQITEFFLTDKREKNFINQEEYAALLDWATKFF